MKITKLNFVIYKHNSTTFHYDLSLEISGKMSSWVIPKGLTLDPSVKRLSIQASEERHREKYGEGITEVWDEGTYTPEVEVSKGVRKEIRDLKEGEKVMQEGLEKGEIKFFLKGKKIKGSFALVKTKGFPPGVKDAWLLIKHKDEYDKIGFEIEES